MKKGQVLLITVMILATVLTVVLSMSFKSVSETKVSKLEEENQKTLAAAEAALEESLKKGTASSFGSGDLAGFSNFTGGAEVITATTNNFTTSLIAKDASYTFYLANYNPETKTFDNFSGSKDIEVCFQSGSPNPAVEIVLVGTDGVKRYPVDPNKGNSLRMSATVYAASTICGGDSTYGYSFSIPVSDLTDNSRLLVVKVLYQSTKLLFHRSTNFPLQGRTVSSSAVSSSGVSKKVTLFQTYPQIPTEFFNTKL
ncbi:hypothetical protein B6D29_04035 [Microgenomates bacterium UTCPR1]|nr:MAG: hypothetical protein B6D29_04035 [Microgenomates bacterium UTCPR1]